MEREVEKRGENERKTHVEGSSDGGNNPVDVIVLSAPSEDEETDRNEDTSVNCEFETAFGGKFHFGLLELGDVVPLVVEDVDDECESTGHVESEERKSGLEEVEHAFPERWRSIS